MSDEELLSLDPCISGFSSSILEMALVFMSLLRVFSSFSELGSEEEEDEDEDDDDDENDEEHEEWTVLLLCRFSESLLSDRSDVMSVFSLFKPAFFSSSSPFLRLFTACFNFDFGSEELKIKKLLYYIQTQVRGG